MFSQRGEESVDILSEGTPWKNKSVQNNGVVPFVVLKGIRYSIEEII